MAGENDGDVYEEGEGELVDWQLPVAFNENRHTEKIEGSRPVTETWRMKERVSMIVNKFGGGNVHERGYTCLDNICHAVYP